MCKILRKIDYEILYTSTVGVMDFYANKRFDLQLVNAAVILYTPTRSDPIQRKVFRLCKNFVDRGRLEKQVYQPDFQSDQWVKNHVGDM